MALTTKGQPGGLATLGPDGRLTAGQGSGGAVSSVAGRTGDVTLSTADVSGAESTTGAQDKADAARNAAIGFAIAVGI